MVIPFLDESFVVYCDYYSLQVNMIAPKFSLFGTNQGGENNIFEKVYVRTEYFRMIIRMIVCVFRLLSPGWVAFDGSWIQEMTWSHKIHLARAHTGTLGVLAAPGVM